MFDHPATKDHKAQVKGSGVARRRRSITRQLKKMHDTDCCVSAATLQVFALQHMHKMNKIHIIGCNVQVPGAPYHSLDGCVKGRLVQWTQRHLHTRVIAELHHTHLQQTHPSSLQGQQQMGRMLVLLCRRAVAADTVKQATCLSSKAGTVCRDVQKAAGICARSPWL
jgi:hypothetical protein